MIKLPISTADGYTSRAVKHFGPSGVDALQWPDGSPQDLSDAINAAGRERPDLTFEATLDSYEMRVWWYPTDPSLRLALAERLRAELDVPVFTEPPRTE